MGRKNSARVIRVKRELTPAERERVRKSYEETEAHKDDLIADAKRYFDARDADSTALRGAFVALRAERQRQGLSLADMKERTGIGRGALSRLENDPDANPTVTTLVRCAKALGMKIEIRLVDEPAVVDVK